jgi:hypothetical protein
LSTRSHSVAISNLVKEMAGRAQEGKSTPLDLQVPRGHGDTRGLHFSTFWISCVALVHAVFVPSILLIA